jgi:hypothetical protein
MALSDTDLEGRLRDLRVRADDLPPAPSDLAGTVRARHHRQRRNQLRLAGAGLAVALVFLAVPLIQSTLDVQHSQTASPSQSAPRPSDRVLYEHPTRGSLAGDDEWLAGINARELVSSAPAEGASPGPLPEESIERRTVAFAGDVPGERVALVVARLRDTRIVQAWFTGPVGAEPTEMALTLLKEAEKYGPLALVDLPDPASPRHVLVVVGFPGDEIEVKTGRSVTASGERQDRWELVPTEDGAGAIALDSPVIWIQDALQVRIARDGAGVFSASFDPRFSARATAVQERASIDLAAVPDPRGARAVVDESLVWEAVHYLIGTYGLHPEEMGLTLLAGGPVEGSGTSTLLAGGTLPSGTTVGFLVAEPFVTLTATAPPGTALLDRVFALGLGGTFVVCGPSAGASAELYDAGGTLIGTVPLLDGAGAIPMPAQEPATVGILDASGALVANTPVTAPDD